MRYIVIIIAIVLANPLQAQVSFTGDSLGNHMPDRNENEQSTSEGSTEPLCAELLISCVDVLPPPSRTGSTSGGIEALEVPQYSSGADIYEFDGGNSIIAPENSN